MEHNETYKPSSEAFARYFSGEASADEAAQIASWIEQSKENREEAEHLKTIWLDVGTLKTSTPEVNVIAAFQNVKRKKAALETPTLSGFWNIWKVAAVLALAAAVVFMLLRSEPDPIHVVAQEIGEVELADGSIITLNKGGSLTYPEKFQSDKRFVEMSGEAFFDISRDPLKPFIIQAGEVTVTVLGTSFNVNQAGGQVEVSVVTGRVEVKSVLGVEILNAGDQVALDFTNQSVQKDRSSRSGAVQYWKTRKLIFESSQMDEVIKDLERVYEVDIEASSQAIYNCKLNATFDGQEIAEVLQIIALTQKLELSQDGGVYYLTGEGCAE